jgi:DNA-directed RNA polymerase specialized sigma24 family protein
MQRVIRLYDLEDLSAREVAVALRLRPGTVRQIRHQAKARLRKMLGYFGALEAA